MAVSEFCATASSEADEALAGTAVEETTTWFLLEVRALWAPKPLASEALQGRPAEVLKGWGAATAGSRLQLIRQPQAEAERPLTLFVGQSLPSGGWLAQTELESHSELEAIDIEAVIRARGGGTFVAAPPLYLVCTHGKRDRCCAKWGMGLFHCAAELAPRAVWQTSHLGGHRFAATALSLRSGFGYGRMLADEAGAWLEAEERGELFDLEKVRGRAAYPGHVQAAELFALGELGLRRHDSLGLREVRAHGDALWTVTFVGPDGAVAVEVGREHTGREARGSCGDTELRPVANFVLRGCK